MTGWFGVAGMVLLAIELPLRRRRSQLPGWLTKVGADMPADVGDPAIAESVVSASADPAR